ncbi:MAG: putative rane protein [Thermomicrobiales bacterium]|jgi:ZIP family zinc transporter|nr:putative rane protein [Thermomicrobiales bacterium]
MIEMLLAAGMAGAAAVLGTALPLWRKPSTLVSSMALGFAAGVMIGTVAFEMLPEALRIASLLVVAIGFAVGFATLYGLELGLNRGKVAGERAEQHAAVEAEHARKRPLGGAATVLAGGTLFEAVVEGISLGVGAAIGAGLTIPLAIAIAIDNLSEGLSLGAIPEDNGEKTEGTRTLRWGIWIAVITLIAAVVGWFVLGNLPAVIHGAVFAAGAGGMLYLTVTQLVPEAEAEHYQQSSAVAAALGFLAILVLSEMH